MYVVALSVLNRTVSKSMTNISVSQKLNRLWSGELNTELYMFYFCIKNTMLGASICNGLPSKYISLHNSSSIQNMDATGPEI